MRLESRIALSLSGVRGGRRPDHDRGCERQSVAEVLRRYGAARDRRRSKIQDQRGSGENREETLDHVQRALTAQSVAYWNEALASVGVPNSPINTLSQLLDHPHTRATGMIVDYDHPAVGPLNGIAHPVLINARHAVRDCHRRCLASIPTKYLANWACRLTKSGNSGSRRRSADGRTRLAGAVRQPGRTATAAMPRRRPAADRLFLRLRLGVISRLRFDHAPDVVLNAAIQSVCGAHFSPSHISIRVLPPPP